MMELYQLRTFSTVAELGSLARATQRLHISQPAASAQIKALEEEFGIVLFDRKPNGLTLTRAGTELLPLAQRLLLAASDLACKAQQLHGQVTGTLKFGAFFDPALLRLGELMSRLVVQHPMLEIEIQHRNSRSVVAGVRSGDLDAGFAMGAGDLPGIAAITLTRLRYRIVAPRAWADRVRAARWPDIAVLPWISTPKEGSHYCMAETLFARHRFTPHKVIEADSESIITSLVFAGVGLGLMREDRAIQAETNRQAVIVGRAKATTLVRFLYLGSREEDPAIKALHAVVREVWPKRRPII